MKVVCVQFDIAWEDKPANFAKVRSLLGSAGVEPGSLIVLPEMFSTGFSMNVAAIAEGDARPAERFLAELATHHRAAVLGGVVTAAPDGRGRNEAVLLDPAGREIARYAKLHPFSYAGEADHYQPGERPVLAELAGAKLAPLICYDLRFPEAFRAVTARGAEVLIVLANWPQPRQDHWAALLRARAIENQACVVGVNRTGSDPNAVYAGGTVVIDPRGHIIREAGPDECVLPADLDLPALRDYRRDFPALADIRPDLLAPWR